MTTLYGFMSAAVYGIIEVVYGVLSVVSEGFTINNVFLCTIYYIQDDVPRSKTPLHFKIPDTFVYIPGHECTILPYTCHTAARPGKAVTLRSVCPLTSM